MPDSSLPGGDTTGPRIGKPGEAVRAINFSGGAFDTAMELGVLHALLVSQGRAPDAVVGVSAGAIHASVLAEVMQAGGEHEVADWSAASAEEKKRVHAARTAARVARFRQILDQLERAPDELVDQLLPDAYQINSQDPLRPTDSPVFLDREREARLAAMGNRSGLIRLYNDLLGFGVTVGNLTRVVRRILGLRASAEVSTPLGRLAVRALEYWRLWILLGRNVARVAPVLTRLTKAYLVPYRPPQGSTAGALIFRFRPLRGIADRVLSLVFFLACLFFWGAFSMTLVLLPIHLAGRDHPGLALALYGLAVLTVVTVYSFNSRMREFERTLTVGGALKALAHGLGASSVPILAWLGLALLFAFALREGPVFPDDPLVLLDPGAWRGAGNALWDVLCWRFWPFLFLGAAGVLYLVLRYADWERLKRRTLRYYRIERSLLHPYPVENLLSRIFDPTYYGKRDLDRVVDEALACDVGPSEGQHAPVRSVGEFAERQPAVHVGIALADLNTGSLVVAPPETSLVDGLVGAVSATPFFPPKGIGQGLYVDAANLANEPMQALFALLRERLERRAQVVHVYSVASVPFTRALAPRTRPLMDLMEVVGEGWTLQRFRDAQLERRLTEQYTESLPDGGVVVVAGDPDVAPEPGFIRAWVTPIEPDEPLLLNRRLFRAKKRDAQRLIRETIADGCRSALERMIGPSLDPGPNHHACSEAVREHIRDRAEQAGRAERPNKTRAGRIRAGIRALADLDLSTPQDPGPGLADICEHCALRRGSEKELRQTLSDPHQVPDRDAEERWVSLGPAWPHEREVGDVLEGDPHHVGPRTEELDLPPLFAGWPRERADDSTAAAVERPTVSFLFSGGVFRGVFQLGALNALSELGLRPDVLAGASVGSITGAMAAGVFAQETPERRRRELARLSAVYLALDRLVLTDRFSDFIRNLTVRAAEARFSLRQADRVFRKYDVARAGRFERDLRVVAAGIERLLYVSPFELAHLTQAVRDRRNDKIASLLTEYVQEWLDRMGVGFEILGAEPLQLLIDEFVIRTLRGLRPAEAAEAPSFGALAKICRARLLATTVNVDQRRLELLGGSSAFDLAVEGPGMDEVRLDQGLLAGSAFPAVFRPRWSHEVFPARRERAQYMDGGVMDNLPLEPTAEFLYGAARAGAIRSTPRGGVPHLLFAASLEPRVRPFREERATWPTILRRAGELSYNAKLRTFAGAQRHLRAIRRDARSAAGRPDLELLIVEPEWLCGTFAFHPMLGFRRDRQAASIGHGCAATLLQFAHYEPEAHLDGWGVDRDAMAEVARDDPPRDLPAVAADLASARHLEEGSCWLRPSASCPFSAQATAGSGLPETSRREIARIHRQCLRPENHQPERR